MDLIYADSNLIDQGVLLDYYFDQCHGKDEQDFSCKIQKYNVAMQGDDPITQDYFLYIDNTEYGGIIDRVESDTKSGEITFKGRTWHGILNSFVIEPPAGVMYRVYSGTINAVLSQMITDIGMSSLFEVDTEDDTDITVTSFEVRYEKAYDCMLRMCERYNGKLFCFYHDGKVHLKGVLQVNYALNEEFDSSQVPFKVGYTHNNVNHLICLGQGDGAKRAVIHLFTDEGGTIQPYKHIDNPLEDSEYILDKRNQIMTGKDEIAEIYDYPNAEVRTNYKPLTSRPNNWNGTYYNYFQRKSGTNDYENIPRVYEDEMRLTDTEFGGCPPDWYENNGYTNYYKGKRDTTDPSKIHYTKVSALPEAQASERFYPQDGYQTPPPNWYTEFKKFYAMTLVEGVRTYTKVQGSSTSTPYELPSIPEDWTWNFKAYYTRTWDGVSWQYHPVQGIPIYDYQPQTSEPTDWHDNYGNYYYLQTETRKYTVGNNTASLHKGEYYTVATGVTYRRIFVNKKLGHPVWSNYTFYTRVLVKEDAPAYVQGTYFGFKRGEDTPPDWVAGKFFQREVDYTPQWISRGQALALPSPDTFEGYYKLFPNQEKPPTFLQGRFYYSVLDRMAELTRGGVERLQELSDTSSLKIDLELSSEYDVGDVIGSIDEVTGISVNKVILRKIIKIKKDIASIDYEVD